MQDHFNPAISQDVIDAMVAHARDSRSRALAGLFRQLPGALRNLTAGIRRSWRVQRAGGKTA
jgi:hypothetical protein